MARYLSGEWGSMVAHMRLVSSRVLEHQALPVADEEALLGSESVDRLQLLAPGFVLPGHVSQHQTAQVGDIFAHGQFAVDLDVIHRDVLGVLVRDAAGALVKLLAILRRPPVAQIALRVELAAFVVEAVGQFVPNGGAGVAVVRGIVRPGIKKRRLQDARRKIDVVDLRDCSRHSPWAGSCSTRRGPPACRFLRSGD